jgi:hypothetical protein
VVIRTPTFIGFNPSLFIVGVLPRLRIQVLVRIGYGFEKAWAKEMECLHFLVVFLGLGFLLCAMWLASYLAKLG